MSLFQNKYNREAFINYLSNSFLPEDFREDAHEISLTLKQNYATKAYCLGECKSLELEVFEIHHTSVNDARVGISKDAFQLLLHHSYCNRALFVFVPSSGGQWRFSLIQIEAEINDKTGRITRGYSNPRRYSFLLGENAQIKTPTQFLIEKGRIRQRSEGNKLLTPIQDLFTRFSIEVLTQEFYEKLYNWYLWAIDKKTGVTFPNNTETSKDDRDDLEIKMIRLITRMLFVWFIKQKNLVPDTLFDKEFLSSILRNFNPNAAENGEYYNAILQNLFFATLNQEREQRGFTQAAYHGRSKSYGIKSLYRDNRRESWFTFPENEKEERVIQLFDKIPYLNGGLFECLDKFELDENDKLIPTSFYDGFSTKDTRLHGNLQYRAFIPNRLFFADEHIETITVEGSADSIEVMGLLELFKQYNFTVEENTTSDKEVSLDPELLGRVFENLLAAYNPETQESARKSTGSFYTPREIVDYMVEEALQTYLTGDCGNDDSEIRLLIKNENTPKVTNPKKVIADLKKIKILDPACGSGAFPMGILLKATDIIERLTPEDEFNRYETKLDIIKNCIYGVDIQAIAMLICKLRFFISLICDCEKDDSKENFGIIPLPNLETKFVAANTLLSAKVREFDDDWTLDVKLQELQKELLNLRLGIFDLRTHKAKLNNKISDRTKCQEIEAYIKECVGRPDEQIILREQKVISDCEAELPKYQGDLWVDETVFQQSLFEENKPTIFRRNVNKEKREELLSRIRIAKANIRREMEKSSLPEFEQAVEQVTHWDPYNQNSISPFFDPEWMFGISDGFDIVIGNPPYISTKGIKVEDKKKYEEEFGFSDDTYNLFTFKGLSLLKEGGSLSYIIPKTFWTTQTKRNMRDLILSNQINYIYDTANPFDAVMVDTCIIQVVKNPMPKEHMVRCMDGTKDLYNPLIFAPIKQSIYLDTQNSVIFKPTDLNLRIYQLYGHKVKELYDKWWDKIETSKKIAQNKEELEAYRASLKPGDIALLGCLTEGGQGLATANNGKYVAVRRSTKWAKNILESRPKKLAEAIKKKKIHVPQMEGFANERDFLNSLTEHEIADLFDTLKEEYGRDIFGQGYIYKIIEDSEIADVEKLTKDEKENGIDPSKKYYVPYDKGDKDGNRWYLETPFAIAWSKENVHFLKTNSGKKGEGMPVVRNPQFYFREGFRWSAINGTRSTNDLKFCFKGKSVNDVQGMSLCCATDIISSQYITAVCNADFISKYTEGFVNSTVIFQINDCRQIPIIIPNKEELSQLNSLFEEAKQIMLLNEENSKDKLKNIKKRLDKAVLMLYHL